MISRFKKIWARYSDEDCVLIYQLGKVGSSSIENAIPNSIHTHTLYGNAPCHVYMAQQRRGFKRLVGKIGDMVKRIAIHRRKSVKIITLIREPVDRNISMYFQDLAHWIYSYAENGDDNTRSNDTMFLHNVFNASFDHFYFDRWFDNEIKKLTKIDVFSEVFPSDMGWKEFRNGKFSLLLIESTKLTNNEGVISQFIGKEITLTKANNGSEKWYGPLYDKFKVQFDRKSYKEKLLMTKYYQHFYDDTKQK